MSQIIINDEHLHNIADAIREKNGESTTYYPEEMAQAIEDIVTDPSGDCTATNNDILLGKTAYANHQLRTGTIPTKTESDVTSVGGVVTIPAGYYASQVQKQGDPSGDATMTSGDQMLNGITAYSQGTKYTGTIPTKTQIDVTITGQSYQEATDDFAWKTNVSIPAGYYASQVDIEQNYSDIFPAPSSEGEAEDLLVGETLFDHSGKKIVGTMPNNSAITATITTQGGTYTVPAGYHNGNGVVTANLPTTLQTAGSGHITLTPGAGSASLSSSNVTLSDTNNGISVTATGSGTVSGVGSGDVSTGSGVITAGTITSNTASDSSSSNSATATKYISAVTVPSSKSFTVNMAADAILNVVDSINNKTWVIKTDSTNNALTIVQAE